MRGKKWQRGGGGRDPVSCTTFINKQIQVPCILALLSAFFSHVAV